MKKRLSFITFIILIVAMFGLGLAACNGAVDITLSFIVDGEVYHTIDTTGDGAITLPNNPTKDGHVFDGWFWEDGRAFTANSLKNTPVEANLSVYAKWHPLSDEEKEFTITFSVIGGGDVPSQTVGYDGLVIRPEDPARAGHILVGWFTEADCTTRWDFTNGKVRSDMTLYAKWVSETDMNSLEIVKSEGITVSTDTLRATVPASQDKYKVFDYLEANPYATIEVYRDDQGTQKIGLGVIDLIPGDNTAYVMITSGTGTVKKLYTLTVHRNYIFDVTFNYNNDNSSDTVQVEEGDLVSSRSAESKTGYTFTQWQSNGSEWAFDTAKVTGNMTLDAIWQANTYTVSFDANGGGSVSDTTATYDEGFIFTVPAREYHTFLGWQTSDGTTLTDGQGNSLFNWNIAAETNLTAEWELTAYTINYTNTYGAENSNPTSFNYQTEAFDLLTLPDTDGLRFVKWTMDESEITAIEGTLAKDITLKAEWDYITYLLTFHLGDGHYNDGESNPDSYNKSENITFTASVSNKQGYAFDGWYDAVTGGSKHTGIIAGTIDDKTYYARYKIIDYVITYNGVYGINNPNPATYTIETDTITLSALAGRNGYNFVEWQDTESETVTSIPQGSMGDITLTAVWDIITYNITYNNTFDIVHSNPSTYTVETETITFADLTGRTGYTFTGWYTAPTGGEKKTAIETGSYGNLSLHAGWDLIEYDIEYIGIYETTNPNPLKYTIEDEFLLIEPSERAGYSFVEWQDASGNVMTGISAGTTGKLETSAIWDLVTYNITYNNTKSMPNNNPTTYTYISEEIILTPLDNCQGYTFTGWYTALTGGEKKTVIEKGSYGNIDLFTVWTENTYSVSLDREVSVNSFAVNFDGNGFEVNIPTQTLTDESSLFYSDIPTRDGYIFGGWYENNEATGNPYDFTAEIKTDIVLYAKWVSSSSPIYVGQSKSIYINGQAYINYEFIPLVSGNITVYTTGSMDTYGYLYQGNSQLIYNDDGSSGTNFSYTYNVTVGVKYTIKVRGYGSGSSGNATLYLSGVTKPPAGGTVVSSNAVIVTYNEHFNLGIPESIIGYAFSGWYTETDCGGTKLTDATGASLNVWSIDGNTVVYSGYERKPYTVSFVTNNGSPLEATSLYYGDRLDLNEYITTRENYSFFGWYLDISDAEAYEATTMPDHNLVLYAKWVVYNLNNFKYNSEKLAISEFDEINAALFNAELFDSDGELVEIVATLNGTKEAGETVSVRLTATGKYNKTKQVTINNIKVYGNPTLSVTKTTKDYINMSDTLNASLFGASGKDTYNQASTLKVFVDVNYTAGDIVTIIIQSVDPAGNITEQQLPNIKVYGSPVITYDTDKTAIKTTGFTIDNEFFNVTAEDSFGQPLTVTTTHYSGTVAVGNTITVRITATDSKGNVNIIDIPVKVYGNPTILNPQKTDFIVTDSITVESLGITATDSHNGVATVTIEKKDPQQAQIAGATILYVVTATDLLGNVTTTEISVKIYGLPIITYKGIKVGEQITLESLNVRAYDSFNEALDVTLTVKSGDTNLVGTYVVVSLSATDKVGNTLTEDYTIGVYAQSDINLSYNPFATDIIRLSGASEEFGATATDSFGEECIITIMCVSDGQYLPLIAGQVQNIVIIATDKAGNQKISSVISDISVYDTPSVTYRGEDFMIQDTYTVEDISFLFIVKDSFSEELYFEYNLHGIIEASNIITFTIMAIDSAGNVLEKTYKFVVEPIPTDKAFIQLYWDGEFYDSIVLNLNSDFTLPVLASFYGWVDDLGTRYTDDNGKSLIRIEDSGIFKLYNNLFTPISSTEELKNISLNGKYYLTCDLDLGREEWTPIGTSSNPFTGIFDGNGYTIANFKITNSQEYVGLFGKNTGTIQNLGVENFIINVYYPYPIGAGGLVGYNYSGTIENSYATGTVSASTTSSTIKSYSYVGGLVGRNYEGKIKNSFATGDVSASSSSYSSYSVYAGGLVGYNDNGTIESSYATGSVRASASSNYYTAYSYAGGLVGYNYSGTIKNSYATGSVSASSSSSSSSYVAASDGGGLVGYNEGIIINSYATGSTSVTSNSYCASYAGGLVGRNNGKIVNSYATGSVSATSSMRQVNIGGLVGYNDDTVENSYATGSISATALYSSVDAGGLVGYNGGTIKKSYRYDGQTFYRKNQYNTYSTASNTDGIATSLENLKNKNWVMQNLEWTEIEIWSFEYDKFPVLNYEYINTAPEIVINTAEQLKSLQGATLSFNYTLGCDIDLGGIEWIPINFYGVFDGNGYNISNFQITNSRQYAGLFGCNYGTIKNLGVENFIIDVTYSGSIYAGGLVGYNEYATITNSYATGSVSATATTSSTSYTAYAGGLVGRNNGKIVNSYATGNVSATTSMNYAHIGGLVGYNEDTVENSYATGNVSATTSSTYSNAYAGGLVGRNYEGKIKNSYATGNVSATTSSTSSNAYAGGLVGYKDSGTITNSYCYSGQIFYRKQGSTTYSTTTNSLGTSTSLSNLKSESFVTGTLKWLTDDWSFPANSFPILKWQE